MKKLSSARCLAVAATTIAVVGVAPASTAAPLPTDTAGGGIYCVYNLSYGAQHCEDSREGLAAYEKQARDVDAQRAAGADAAPSTSAAGPVRLATVYQKAGIFRGLGREVTFTGDGGCPNNGRRDHEIADLRHITMDRLGRTWNDRISAFVGYGGCDVTLYTHSNFRGEWYGPTPESDNLGDLNDEATSITFG